MSLKFLNSRSILVCFAATILLTMGAFSALDIKFFVLFCSVIIANFILITYFSTRYYTARNQKDVKSDRREIIYTLLVHEKIGQDLPLPDFGGWRLSADLALYLLNKVENTKANLIVELGSGLSTIICGLMLKKMNRGGKIISIEHDKDYLAELEKQLRFYDVKDFVDLVHAPLTKDTHSETSPWYDSSRFPTIDANSIDILIVDGPPRKFGSKVRSPAASYFLDRMKVNGEIILDDGHRHDEKEIVKFWLSKYPRLYLRGVLDTEKYPYIMGIKP